MTIFTAINKTSASTIAFAKAFKADEGFALADADQDGITAALKAVGITYPQLDTDAAILDGSVTGKTAEALSSLGFGLVRAWGAIPPFGTPNRDTVFVKVVEAFVSAIAGERAELDRLAVEYEAKVTKTKELAATAIEPFAGFRFVEIPAGVQFDPPTLGAAMDRGVLISARQVDTGPIAKVFGSQLSLARTKDGEKDGIDLAALAAEVFGPCPEKGWGPNDGVISNTPFLLHLSPERWEAFRPVLEEALTK